MQQQIENHRPSCPLIAFCQWKEGEKRDNWLYYFARKLLQLCGIESVVNAAKYCLGLRLSFIFWMTPCLGWPSVLD